MNISPIRTVQDYEVAVARIEVLFDAVHGTSAFDELDILATLVEQYEIKNFPIGAADAVDAINFRMEQLGLQRKDLEPYIGSRARVSEVLNRKRSLTLAMARRLYEHLQVPAECLIQHTKRV